MRFLRSRYVLILLLMVLVIEGVFRLGFYEPLVSPLSHSGRTIALMRSLEDFGKDNIDIITLGDSRAVQGLDNRRIMGSPKAAYRHPVMIPHGTVRSPLQPPQNTLSRYESAVSPVYDGTWFGIQKRGDV